MKKDFLTIKKNTTNEIDLKKSKFIAQAFKVNTQNDIAKIMNKVKNNHPKANHYVSAYIIKENNQIQHKSDDGEPEGSAGLPILNVLKSNKLSNVIIVVIRYFGGIKLGKSGLMRAYSYSATAVIKKAQINTMVLTRDISIEINYKDLNKLKYYAQVNHLTIKNIIFNSKIQITLAIHNNETTNVKNKIKSLLNGNINFIKSSSPYYFSFKK